MKTKLLILALFTTMLAACGPGPDPVLELKLTEEEQIFNSRQNQAGIDLLCLHASDEEENTIISPLSINIASAMLANGAKNATQEQILNAIGAEGYSIDFLNDYNSKLMKTLPHLDQTTDMRIANGIWLDDDIRPVENFVHRSTPRNSSSRLWTNRCSTTIPASSSPMLSISKDAGKVSLRRQTRARAISTSLTARLSKRI